MTSDTEHQDLAVSEDGGIFYWAMPIKDVLDRFEILSDQDSQITQLRRAYNDKDLMSIFRLSGYDDLRKAVMDKNIYSIFRLLESYQPGAADHQDIRKAVIDQQLNSIFRLYQDTIDLRKAIVDENLQSIFKLMGKEDLAKFVLNDDRLALYRMIKSITSTHFADALKNLEEGKIPFYHDCMSRGQLKSKQWAVNQLKEINRDLGVTFLCAGWYGTLATLIFESRLRVTKIRSFDIDPGCEEIAEIFNEPWVSDGWKFKSVTKDINDIDYSNEIYQVNDRNGHVETLVDKPNTVINTSCEHIGDFDNWYCKIPKGTLLALQTNDFKDIEDHVNCSTSLEQFESQTPMAVCLYQGELDLGSYKRFMRIGYR